MAILRAGSGVLRRKPIEHIEEPEAVGGEQLTRVLGLWQLTAIGVGGIIGAGIFTLAGAVANGIAGPAVVVSFLIAGVASAAAAFSYAEFAGLIPKAGSAYTYGYAVLGELVGWFIGWDLLLEYTAIVAVVAIGISGYFSFLLGDPGRRDARVDAGGAGDGRGASGGPVRRPALPADRLPAEPRHEERGPVRDGRRRAEGRRGAGGHRRRLLLRQPVQLHPFFPYGIGGAFTGAATVFFAVFGYDAMSTAAEESKDASATCRRRSCIRSPSRWSSTCWPAWC